MTPRIDGTQGNFDNPKRVIHNLTPEEKKAGSIFTEEMIGGMGPNQGGTKITNTYKDLDGDGFITKDELQSVKEDTYNQKHQLEKSNLYKDVNKDGKLDLYMIDKYTYNADKTASVNRYMDKNGDGYSDEFTRYEYDKQRNLVSKETKVEEDINSVKNRNHLDHEIYNRKMSNLDNGVLIAGLEQPTNASGDDAEKTEVFIDSLMPKILQTQSRKDAESRKMHFSKLVVAMQIFNGSIKNNLSDIVEEIGSPEQIEMYNSRIKEKQGSILVHAGFVGGVEAIQNPETKLYQLKIGNEIIDVPERKVKLGEDTEDEIELIPVIDD